MTEIVKANTPIPTDPKGIMGEEDRTAETECNKLEQRQPVSNDKCYVVCNCLAFI